MLYGDETWAARDFEGKKRQGGRSIFEKKLSEIRKFEIFCTVKLIS
jgi:hypothetical protein